MKNFNFIHEDLPESDRDLFFGPLTEDDEFIFFGDDATMVNIVVEAGLFPSFTRARKSGEDKPIPTGFTDIHRGKNANKRRVTILNKF
ncbi:MAG: hypothetical protein HOK57_10075 [Planctomycetaceae bacterium]|jgi:hypothetical protein|nr:hypothetical protein [Bacteroidetes Order II. bacterium]MBT6460160.1 hypothetical protein [Planctomycetaceae bacterium]